MQSSSFHINREIIISYIDLSEHQIMIRRFSSFAPSAQSPFRSFFSHHAFRYCSSSNNTTAAAASASLVKPVMSIYGHCSGYHINEVLSTIPSIEYLQIADVYVAGREDLHVQQQQQQQQQQHSESVVSPIPTTDDSAILKKKRSVSLFRGLELDAEGVHDADEEDDDDIFQRKDEADEDGELDNEMPSAAAAISSRRKWQQQQQQQTIAMNGNNNNNALPNQQQTATATPTSARSYAFLSHGAFAHVVLHVSKNNGAVDGTMGIFSNGAVVSFGLDRSVTLEVTSLFRDCEQQDGILFPHRRGWRHRTFEARRATPLEISAVQEFSFTTIGDLPALGYDVPSEIEELSQQYFDTTTSDDEQQQQQQQQQQAAAAAEKNGNNNNNDVDDHCVAEKEGEEVKRSEIPPFIGYFDADSLSAIVVPDSTVEAQLPFMHALAESVEVEALSATLEPIAVRSQNWREAIERKDAPVSKSWLPLPIRTASVAKPLFCIASKHEVRTTYLQALRLSALCARSMSRSGAFWTMRHAPQRVTYECAYEHLEVQRRLALVQRQIETVSKTVSYLGDELRADTDERLEWAVVFLISVTVITQLYM